MIKRSLLANYLGQGWVALAGLAFIPVYVSRLGVEAYGLIGFYTLLQAWFSFLDLGMTPTIIRETSRYASGAESAHSLKNLVRSFEVIVFSLALIIALGLWSISGLLAESWISAIGIPQETVSDVLAVISFVVAARYCEGIYRGVLYGLDKQVVYNLFYASISTVRYIGAAIIVTANPSLTAFFLWQALISIITIIALGLMSYRYLPKTTDNPSISLDSIRKVGVFAGGLSITTLLALVFTQIDKLMLTKLVDMESFGIYTLALAICGLFPMLAGPAASAFFPKFSSAVSTKNTNDEKSLFEKGAQIVSICAVPVFSVCLLQGYQLVFAWTGDINLAGEVGPILTIVSVGGFCSALMQIPFMLQLAHGWTSISVKINIFGIVILVPATYVGIVGFGLTGAASAWAITNLLLLIVYIPLLNKRLLNGELFHYVTMTNLFPLILSLSAIFLVSKVFSGLQQDRFASLGVILFSSLLSLFITLYALPLGRQLLCQLPLAKLLSRMPYLK